MIEQGWLVGCLRRESPNFNQRPCLAAPHVTVEEGVNLLVIHNISLPPRSFGGSHIVNFFQNRLDPHIHPYFETLVDVKVSAHCLIDRRGRVTQFVSFLDRAWHAGRSVFNSIEECNDYAIGVELEGSDFDPYTDAQYSALAALTRTLMRHYPHISPDRIAGHSDIAPGRKTDPGPYFDWLRFKTELLQLLAGER